MRSRQFLRALILVGLLEGIAMRAAAQEVDYLLGPQDIFSVTVWGLGGASERFTVETDGSFTFPLLGRLKAGGLTVRQLQDELTHRLRDGYFTDPRVTVTVEDYRSQRIFVVGEVNRPGPYSLTRSMTLIEALTLAGSPTTSAGSVALIRRRTSGEASKTPVTHGGDGITEIRADLTALQDGVLSDNPILRDGDTIAVPRTAPVLVFGHVARPGEFNVGRDATIRQVIALAGGVTQRGAAGRIKIVRTINGTEHELKAGMDDPVKPGDTIIVPERYF